MTAEAIGPEERRTRRWCMAAALALFPALLVADSWRAARDMLHARELFATRAGDDGVADYAGARFRLSSFRVFADSPDPRLAVPKDRALVLARLKATLGREPGDDWAICRLSLVDGQGREWAPAALNFPFDVVKLVEPDGKSPATCGTATLEKPKAGQQIEFGANYVVPRDALDTLTLRFSVMGERPWALEFPRPARPGP